VKKDLIGQADWREKESVYWRRKTLGVGTSARMDSRKMNPCNDFVGKEKNTRLSGPCGVPDRPLQEWAGGFL